MEAARVASLRGHTIRLVERRSWLGGAIRLAAQAPGRERLATLADWLEAECRTLGVTIEVDHKVTTAEIEAAPAVIFATGARHGLLPFGTEPGAIVVQARTLLEAHHEGGMEAVLGLLSEGSILVWDPIGGPIAVSVAEMLATVRAVELVTHDQVVGNLLARSGDMGTANTRLHGAGVALHKRSLLRDVGPGWAEIEAIYTGKRERLEVGAVVACGHEFAEDALWDSATQGAAAKSATQHQAGDAVAPRTLYEAVLEGRRAALAIERTSPA